MVTGMEMNTDWFENNFGKVLAKELLCQTIPHCRLHLKVCPMSKSPYTRLKGYSSKNSNCTYKPDVRLILAVLFSLDGRLKDFDVSGKLMELITKY